MISFLNGAVSNDCITKYVTDKGAVSIRINNTKVKSLKEQITSLGSYQNIEFVKATTSKTEIRNSKIISLCQNVEKYTSLKKKETERVYREQIVKLKENYYDNIENLSKIIAKFDVILNKMYISVKYKYSKPQIDNNSEVSYFDAKYTQDDQVNELNRQSYLWGLSNAFASPNGTISIAGNCVIANFSKSKNSLDTVPGPGLVIFVKTFSVPPHPKL